MVEVEVYEVRREQTPPLAGSQGGSVIAQRLATRITRQHGKQEHRARGQQSQGRTCRRN